MIHLSRLDLNSHRASSFLRQAKLCLTLLTIFAALAVSNSQAQVSTPLQGIVQQYASETKPLHPSLWPGRNFDKEAARKILHNPEQETGIWHRIPDWQSGNWEASEAENIRAIKYIDGVPSERQPIGKHKASGQFKKGLLADKKKEIWHMYPSDYWTETDHGDQIVESYVLYSSPGAAEFPDLYAESVDFNIDKTSKRILSVRHAKVWTRYVNAGPGVMREETLRTNFDEQGHPTATSLNVCMNKRTQPFALYAASFLSNKAIVTDFFNYLQEHDLSSLKPTLH
jgi:hypothetical protein